MKTDIPWKKWNLIPEMYKKNVFKKRDKFLK